MPFAHLPTPDGVWAVALDRPPSRLSLPLQVALRAETIAHVALEKAADTQMRIERGLHTDDCREYFISGPDFAGVLTIKRKIRQKDDGTNEESWSASLASSNLPRVLSKEAVDAGLMPPPGDPALPATLAKVVPTRLQYWKLDGEAARAARDRLASSGLFDADLIKVVDGELRLCTARLYLYEPDDADVQDDRIGALKAAVGGDRDVVLPLEQDDWVAAFNNAPADALVILASKGEDDIVSICAKLVAEPRARAPFLIIHSDTDLARFAMGEVGRIFKLAGDASGDIYVYSGTLADTRHVVWQDLPLELAKSMWPAAYVNDLPDSAFLYIAPGGSKDDEGKTTPRSLRYFPVYDSTGALDLPHVRNALARIPQAAIPQSAKDKATADARRLLDAAQKRDAKTPQIKRLIVRKADGDDATNDERYVLGIVLEPETRDSQGDIYSADEVRKACHNYMAEYRGCGYMHQKDISDKVSILENYIAPCDFTVGEESVKAGTWLQAFRINDDALWKQCKNGDLTGLSIGGSAIRRREDLTTTDEPAQTST